MISAHDFTSVFVCANTIGYEEIKLRHSFRPCRVPLRIETFPLITVLVEHVRICRSIAFLYQVYTFSVDRERRMVSNSEEEVSVNAQICCSEVSIAGKERTIGKICNILDTYPCQLGSLIHRVTKRKIGL